MCVEGKYHPVTEENDRERGVEAGYKEEGKVDVGNCSGMERTGVGQRNKEGKS